MEEVLFINPRSWDRIPSYIPTGLCYMASVLRNAGIKVGIYDKNVERKDVSLILSGRKAKIYGISVLTGKVILDGIDVSLAIRRLYPDAIIVWGGLHPTIFPEAVLREDYVDYIVRGEGEYPMLELVKYLLSADGSLENIKNLGYKKEGKFILNPIRPFIDLESLPFPAWDLLGDIRNYFVTRNYASRTLNLNTSRGCPHRCAFCYNEVVNKRKWRGMSAKRVIEQIEYLRKEYGIDGVFFHEDNFDVNRKRLVEFCNLLLEKKIRITWEHFSKVNYADETVLRLERKSGCRIIAYGLESGSDRILAAICKDQTKDDIRRAMSICKKVGIKAAVGFIIGYPMETMGDLKETLDLVDEVKPFYTFAQVYLPYPGTELFTYIVDNKLFRMPDTLRGQGQIYSVDNVDLNMSAIPKGYLYSIIRRYGFCSILNEIFAYARSGNLIGFWRALQPSLQMSVFKNLFEGFFFAMFQRRIKKRRITKERD